MVGASPRVMMSRQNMLKPPQYAPEGATPETFGVLPANPNFLVPGQRTWIESTNEPEFADNEYGGHFDRQGIVKTREKNRFTYHSRLIDTVNRDVALMKAAMTLPGGGGTSNESFTWLDSYQPSDGGEIYRVWRGCKPASSTLNVNKTDPVMFDVEYTAQRYYETSTLADAFALGGGTLASALPNAERFRDVQPLRYKDVGRMYYGAAEIAYRSLTLTCTYTMKVQDSNGLEYDAYCEPSARRITGSVDIFKSGNALNEDARAGVQRPGYAVIHDRAADEVAASVQIAGAFRLTARVPGTWGNQLKLRINIAAPGTGAQGRARVDGTTVIVEAQAAITNARVKAAIEENRQANDLVSVSSPAPAGNVAAKVETAFAGGTDADWKLVMERMRFLPSAEPLIDDSEATMESKTLEADVITVYG